MAWPSRPMTLPSDVNRDENGLLRPHQVQAVMAPGHGMVNLHPLAARAFNALQFMCWVRINQQLTVVSMADAYRDLNRQTMTFLQRYIDRYIILICISATVKKWWQSKWWWQKRGTAMAASPGTSNHGWGLAFDAAWWMQIKGKWKIMGVTANPAAFNWLLANAPDYGFYWNVKSEAWHLEYVMGDAVPQKVLDVEALLGIAA